MISRMFASDIFSTLPIPFPPCGGRLGWGVMQCDAVESIALCGARAPDGALPPIQLRLCSLRSL